MLKGWLHVAAWVVLLGVIFSIFTALKALAHSWYDPACCSDNDCAPDDRVKEVPGGFQVPTGEIVPYGDKRIRQSLDKQFHWCHFQNFTYCVYVPGGVG
jgi:hypothetical protein